eukprot:gene29311-38385_t
MGSSASVSNKYEVDISAPQGTQIYRRDLKDRSIIESLIKLEIEKIKTNSTGDKKADNLQLKTYVTACWDTYQSLSELYASESHAYNTRFDIDLDHWYEINLANRVLFDNLHLVGMQELLPGRLFSTRMPRNIKKDPDSANKFRKKCTENNLHTVLILTETEEYEKYAGADLEEFYRSLKLEIIHRPIADFTIPNQPDMIQNIKDLTWRLAEGKNCLVHCAGGSGRTGMVIAGMVKNIGVHDPTAWVRRVKTQYVETIEQEQFIKHMTPVLDSRIAQKFPLLAKLKKQHSVVTTNLVSIKSAKSSDNEKIESGGEEKAFFRRYNTSPDNLSGSSNALLIEDAPSFPTSPVSGKDDFFFAEDDDKKKSRKNSMRRPDPFFNTTTTVLEDYVPDDPNDRLLNETFDSKRDLVSRLTQIDFNMTFDLINTSHSDHITVKEITTLFKMLGVELNDQQIKSMMDLMDDDGQISRQEFITLMSSNSQKMN